MSLIGGLIGGVIGPSVGLPVLPLSSVMPGPLQLAFVDMPSDVLLVFELLVDSIPPELLAEKRGFEPSIGADILLSCADCGGGESRDLRILENMPPCSS